MKKILILGISSFSGATLASFLSEKNFKVFGTFSKEKNIYYLPFNKKKIKIFKINLLKDIKKLLLLINKIKPEVVIDHASICMVEESWFYPDRYFIRLHFIRLRFIRLHFIRHLLYPVAVYPTRLHFIRQNILSGYSGYSRTTGVRIDNPAPRGDYLII